MGEEVKAIVPESVLKKQKRAEEWALVKNQEFEAAKKRAQNRKLIYNRAKAVFQGVRAADSGCVFTCGDGSFGQLGHGDYASHASPVNVSYFVDQPVAKVACGMRHSLVLLKGCPLNQVYGFGSGKRGQLGVFKDRIKSINLSKVISGFEDAEIIDIAANGDHSAALSVGGHLYTWGRGFKGFEDSHILQCLNSTLNFTKATLGWNHALAMTDEGEAYMFGGPPWSA